MRDQTKVIIGFGSIWGLYAFGALLLSSFTLGSNDTGPEVIALVLYGVTLLPSCILTIWYRRVSALWLMVLAGLTAGGFTYQLIAEAYRSKLTAFGSIVEMLVVAASPLTLALHSFEVPPKKRNRA